MAALVSRRQPDRVRSARRRDLRIPRRARPRNRRLLLEQLEARLVLSSLPLEGMRDRLKPYIENDAIQGATIVTHGFRPNGGGDSLISLAQAIRNRADDANGNSGTAWLLDYDVRGEGALGFFDTDTSQQDDGVGNGSILPEDGTWQSGEVVLLFDWAPESNESSDGWGEAAGDALFSIITGLGLVDPLAGAANIPLHFIAHSFGTAVTSEAVERLAAYGVPVDHVTYLDPHEFDEDMMPVDGAQRLFELGHPAGYGASVWSNVTFADAYYQTEDSPEGRPIPGAYNVVVNDEINDLNPNAHSAVWEQVYSNTVGPGPASGYAFSRIAGGQAEQPAATFYSTIQSPQDHQNSAPELVNTSTGRPNNDGLRQLGLTAEDVTQGRWEPEWDPALIVNGDFESGPSIPDAAGSVAPWLANPFFPGWSDHGGSFSGTVSCNSETKELGTGLTHTWCLTGPSANRFAVLTSGDSAITHNRLYVPPDAVALRFDRRRK